MKAGLTTSVVGHLLLLAWGLFQLPSAKPFEVEQVEALPVDLVALADVSQIAEGTKTAPVSDNASQAKVETPAPRPESERAGAAPTDQDAPITPKASDTAAAPEASAPPPTPAPPPPKADPPPEPKPPEPAPPEPAPEPPAPEPTPEPPPPAPTPAPEKPAEAPKPTADAGEIKAAPEKPAEDPKPEPEEKTAEAEPAPAPAVKPTSKPKPPKPVEVASAEDAPATPQPDRKTPKKPAEKQSDRPEKKAEKEFDVNDMSALLSKVDPSGGGAKASTKEASLGSERQKGPVAKMTQSELDALRARVSECWTPIAGGMDDGGDKSVLLRIEFNPDGSLASNPTVKRAPSGLMAEYAIRAVIRCAPYGDVLPPEKYDVWQIVNINFDPSAMF